MTEWAQTIFYKPSADKVKKNAFYSKAGHSH